MSAPEQPPHAGGPDVGAIHDALPKRAEPAADAGALAERQGLINDRLRKEIQLLQAEVDDRQQDRRERLKYADRIFRLIVWWLVWMGGIVLAQGLAFPDGALTFGFDLAEPIIIALVGGTTASVIGIFLIVANYLFPKDAPASRDGGADRR